MSLAEALKILEWRAYFPDLDSALSMVGISRIVDGHAITTLASGTAMPPEITTIETDDEEEHVSWSDDWDVDEEESDDDHAIYQTDKTLGNKRPIPLQKSIVDGSTPLLPAIGYGLGARNPAQDHPRIGDTRSLRPKVYGHILQPRPSKRQTVDEFEYQSVPLSRPTHYWNRGPVATDEKVWKLAADCLDAAGLQSTRFGHTIDIDSCVDILAKLAPVERLPTHSRIIHRGMCTVLRDAALIAGPLHDDAQTLTMALRENNHSESMGVLAFHQTLGEIRCGSGPIWTWKSFDISECGEIVLVITALEPSACEHLEYWRFFARTILDSNRRFVFVNIGSDFFEVTDEWPGTWHFLDRSE